MTRFSPIKLTMSEKESFVVSHLLFDLTHPHIGRRMLYSC
jgi:hypothetical protein